MNSKLSIIVAMDEKRGIGKKNALMWHIPGELPRFKHITTGHPIIMGRKTFESIGRVLPNRTNIIITRDEESFLNSHPEFISGSEMLNSPLSSKRAPFSPPVQHDSSSKAFVVTSLDTAIDIGKKVEESRIIHSASSEQVNQESSKNEKNHDSQFMIHNSDESEVFIIGGGQIFEQALSVVDRLYLTLVKGDFGADTFFPEYQSLFPKVVSSETHQDDTYTYTFETREK